MNTLPMQWILYKNFAKICGLRQTGYTYDSLEIPLGMTCLWSLYFYVNSLKGGKSDLVLKILYI